MLNKSSVAKKCSRSSRLKLIEGEDTNRYDSRGKVGLVCRSLSLLVTIMMLWNSSFSRMDKARSCIGNKSPKVPRAKTTIVSILWFFFCEGVHGNASRTEKELRKQSKKGRQVTWAAGSFDFRKKNYSYVFLSPSLPFSLRETAKNLTNSTTRVVLSTAAFGATIPIKLQIRYVILSETTSRKRTESTEGSTTVKVQ